MSVGVSVGVIQTQMPQPERRTAYACDVTYTTNKQVAFNYLRDRLEGAGARQAGVRVGGGPGGLDARVEHVTRSEDGDPLTFMVAAFFCDFAQWRIASDSCFNSMISS